jgi:S-adenosylmethionine:tRNA ribosyltransferase-isomerase
LAAGNWSALVRPGRKVRIGDQLEFATPSGSVVLQAEVIAAGELGERVLRFSPVEDFFAVLEQIGHMPLPPYIKREDASRDHERYQTVFAAQRGSVAAPTAGLHFTPAVLDAIATRGVEIAKLTLHVGLGTFAPLRVERVEEIRLHRERYTLPTETANALNRARAEGRRIVAVGTTAVRTLEHCALQAETSSSQIQPHTGETSIFISPGFQFRLVGAMLTNFHLPKSSLLMLVSAFAGRERVLAAYAHAVRHGYRFFSYGDCMFLS